MKIIFTNLAEIFDGQGFLNSYRAVFISQNS